jgi:hypothetical protein
MQDNFATALIFSHLDLSDALNLRVVSKSYKKLCKTHQWNFVSTNLSDKCSIKMLKQIFPNTIGLNISNKAGLVYQDFKYLKGVKYLKMSNCNCSNITRKSFKHLAGILELNISGCNNLMGGCKLFDYLSSLKVLNISFCAANDLYDNDFSNLYNLETLILDTTGSGFHLTDDVFRWLQNLVVLQCCWGLNESAFSFTKICELPKLICFRSCCMRLSDNESKIFENRFKKFIGKPLPILIHV